MGGNAEDTSLVMEFTNFERRKPEGASNSNADAEAQKKTKKSKQQGEQPRGQEKSAKDNAKKQQQQQEQEAEDGAAAAGEADGEKEEEAGRPTPAEAVQKQQEEEAARLRDELQQKRQRANQKLLERLRGRLLKQHGRQKEMAQAPQLSPEKFSRHRDSAATPTKQRLVYLNGMMKMVACSEWKTQKRVAPADRCLLDDKFNKNYGLKTKAKRMRDMQDKEARNRKLYSMPMARMPIKELRANQRYLLSWYEGRLDQNVYSLPR